MGFPAVEGDLDFFLTGDDVVVGDDVALTGDDDAGALALGGVIPEAHAAAPDVEELLTAHAGGVDADDRGDDGLGELGVFVIEAGEELHVF